ncbi:MAG: diguanylate cyclase [Methylococcaceae bacterium]
MTELTQKFKVEQRKGKSIALLTLNFQVLQNSLTHARTRELLMEVNKIFRQRIRESDSLVQINDVNEHSFVVLLDNLHTLNNAQKIANSLVENFSELLNSEEQDSLLDVNVHVDFVPQDDCQEC